MDLHSESDDGYTSESTGIWNNANRSGLAGVFQPESGQEMPYQPDKTGDWIRPPLLDLPRQTDSLTQPTHPAWDAYSVTVAARLCSSCCAPLDENASTCPVCGAAQAPAAPQPAAAHAPVHNRATAALLAIFLGDFGLHKFYLGQPKLGMVYLLLFWTLIPGLIGLIEGLSYLFQTDKQFSARYD